MRSSFSTLNALFPDIRQRVLTTTLLRPDKWWYLSELAQTLHTTPSSLQRELAALARVGLLERRRDGGRAYFRAELRSPIYKDLRNIFDKTVGLVPKLRALLAPLGEKIDVAFVYGSIARGRARATSDIDLAVVGTIGLAELAPILRKAEAELQREINVTVYTAREFHTKIARADHFLSAVLRGTLQFVKGQRSDLDAITGKRSR